MRQISGNTAGNAGWHKAGGDWRKFEVSVEGGGEGGVAAEVRGKDGGRVVAADRVVVVGAKVFCTGAKILLAI